VLYLLAAFFCRKALVLGGVPNEDAAILLRYSANLASGHGIVWNVGSLPVDGATDFLSMVAIAGLIKAGLAPLSAVQGLDLFCHLLTGLVIFGAMRRVEQADIVSATVSALYLVAGPGLVLTSTAYATPVFVLMCATTWWLALKLMMQEARHLYGLMFAFSGLVLSLTRPEGVILAVLMLLSIVTYRKAENSLGVCIEFGALFAVIGGGYFLWHRSYFGHSMPLPFYRKGGRLYFNSLNESVHATIKFAGPFLLAYPLGLRKSSTFKLAFVFLIPVAGFAAAWVLLSNEMNFMSRFQYPVLPVILMSWYPLLKDLPSEIPLDRALQYSPRQRELALWAAKLGICVYVLLNASRLDVNGNVSRPFNYDVALALSRFGHRNVLATTEAGIVPFYSGWITIDTWGLNDPHIAMNGLIDRQYLDAYKPDVILIEGPFNVASDDYQMGPQNAAWKDMVRVLKCFARENRYIVAAAFGASPYDTMTYFVRQGDKAAEITEAIRGVQSFPGTVPPINFAAPFTNDAAGAAAEPLSTADNVPDRSISCNAR
jgi:hypothetical protein